MPVTMEQVMNQLDREEPNYAQAAQLGAEALPQLITLIQGEDLGLAAKAASLAGIINSEQSATVLDIAAQHPDPVVRVAAAASVSILRPGDANKILVQLLEDTDIGVRKFAIRAISEANDAAVHAKLRSLRIQDPAPLIRAIAQDKMRELRLIDTSATVLLTNLDQPDRATTIVPSDAGWAAQSFVTDDSDYWLESIEIIAGHLVGTPSIIAELRGGDATGLGDTLGTFTVPDLTTDDPQNVKLTPNNPIRLSPDTTHWLVLGTSGEGTFGWTYAEGNGQAGSGTLGQYAYSEDQGVTWNINNPDSNLYKLEVLVYPVSTQ